MFRAVVSVILMLYLFHGVNCIKSIKSRRTDGGVATELAMLAVFGSERAIIVRNEADAMIRAWCSSKDDSTGEQKLEPGESMGFKFNPMVIGGHTLFWCTVDYKGFWARWDAFGGDDDYYTNDKNAKAYEFEVRNDGVYIKGKKIRGLNAGKNKYVLWEHYDGNKKPFGASLTGYVDDGMCNNLPGWMETKTSAATVCDGQCIVLHDQLHCRGEFSKLKAEGGCTDFWLTNFNDRARSVKGC